MDTNTAIDFPIIGYFDRQRYLQFNPSDTANWYLVDNPLGKKKVAMYPVTGRRHVSSLGSNRFIFIQEPRAIFSSVNYGYIVVANTIFRIDHFNNQLNISGGLVTTLVGNVFFDYIVAGTVTYAVFTDGQHVYIYNESTSQFYVVTDPNTPATPTYIATFGNRIAVSSSNSSEYRLSAINLAGGALGTFDPALVFTVAGAAVFAQEAGIIRQMCVLHNQLYIFTDFTTGIWSNTPSVFTSAGNVVTTFPWKKNSTYDWDYGMLNPNSLDVSFGRMVWTAQNKEGLIQVMSSGGEAPKRISTRAVDILFQRNSRRGIIGNLSPFISGLADGFLYQWENTILYRLSAGEYTSTGILDVQTNANAIEFNFETETWHRVIEKNGERNRIKKHTYYNNMHLVTVDGESTVYEMSGQFYDNEVRNSLQENPQAIDAYNREPFRYERTTQITAQEDYAEFITDWVQIDFVWGESYNIFWDTSIVNDNFIINPAPDPGGNPQYLVANGETGGEPNFLFDSDGNILSSDSELYYATFKPHIELYYSDDGGVTFLPADVREFAQSGQYSWRMRWYQLGVSRNRCYKLICVADSPIVVLGGIMMTRRVSDGAA